MKKLFASKQQKSNSRKEFAKLQSSIVAFEEIPEVQAYSKNFNKILPEESKKIYIPGMTHPFKRNSFKKFVEKQIAKLQKELEDVS